MGKYALTKQRLTEVQQIAVEQTCSLTRKFCLIE